MAKLAKARDCNVVQVILRSGVRVTPGRKFLFFSFSVYEQIATIRQKHRSLLSAMTKI